MNVLIIGTGAVGIAIATSLISQNVNVSLFAKNAAVKLIEEEGINFKRKENEFKYGLNDFELFSNYMDLPRNYFDYILICSKTIANGEISYNLSKNKDILKADGKIIIFQNGFSNDEPYLNYFNKNQVYCARIITGLKRIAPNVSKATLDSTNILLGSLQNGDINSLKDLTSKFNDFGFETDVTCEISDALWAKMIYNCALNPLGGLLNMKTGKLCENEYSLAIINDIIDEVFEVMDAAGYKTYWKDSTEYKEVFFNELVKDTANHESSTLQDIKNRNKTEIDSFCGKIVELGDKYNVNVPVNSMIYKLVKAIESDF